MATPTDQQQIRATLRRGMRNAGADATAALALREAIMVLGEESVVRAILAERLVEDNGLMPRVMGAAEAAEVLKIAATNINRLNPPLPVAAVISGRIPIYRESDVLVVKARLDERRARRRANERERAERARVEAGQQALGSVTP